MPVLQKSGDTRRSSRGVGHGGGATLVAGGVFEGRAHRQAQAVQQGLVFIEIVRWGER